MNLLSLGVALLAGAAIGAVTVVTVQDAIVTWLEERAEQRRKDKGWWLAHEQRLLGRSVRRMK